LSDKNLPATTFRSLDPQAILGSIEIALRVFEDKIEEEHLDEKERIELASFLVELSKVMSEIVEKLLSFELEEYAHM
jgi:hypothetical protein